MMQHQMLALGITRTRDVTLRKAAVEAAHGDLRRLHDDVLRVEKGLIASKDPGYPLYVVNVPQQRLYFDSFPAEKFFL